MFRFIRNKGSILTAILLPLILLTARASAGDPFSDMGVILPKKRVEAPAFTLEGVDGSWKGIGDFRGRIILLNFWATWCAPCRDEMPAMENLWRELKDRGVTIIAVAGDRGMRSMHMVNEFCRMHEVTFPVLLDPKGKVRNAYEVTVLPTSYIIGRDGKITGKIVGAREWSSEGSKRLFERLLSR